MTDHLTMVEEMADWSPWVPFEEALATAPAPREVLAERAHSYGGDRQFWDLFGLAMAMAVSAPEASRRSQLAKRPLAA